MPATVRRELGAPTYAKKWFWDANAGTYEAPVWTPINGISSFQEVIDPTTKDNSQYASGIWGSDVVSKLKFRLEAKLWRNVDPDDAQEYDAGQEILREASDKAGILNRVDVRWYEMPDDGPRKEAYRGYVSVAWKPDGGSDEELSSVTVTCNGQGARTAITHPSPNS
jgi:hypothetical protein